MARRKQSSPPTPEPPEISPDKGIRLLRTAIKKAEDLIASRPLSSDEYSSWELLTQNYLEKAFGRHSHNVSSVMNVGKFGSFPMGPNESWYENHRWKSLQTQKKKLEGLIDVLETEIQLENGTSASTTLTVSRHKIFLVHGHDGKMGVRYFMHIPYP